MRNPAQQCPPQVSRQSPTRVKLLLGRREACFLRGAAVACGYTTAVADIYSQAQRSKLMARIRSRGNARTELALVRIFRAHRITGWRRQIALRGEAPAARGRRMPSSSPSRAKFQVRPDFIFPKLRLAVFVDGCFWHGTKPKGNAAFWRKKFAANVARDRRADRALRRAGWHILRIWEHELARKREPQLVRRLRRWFSFGVDASRPARAK